MVIEFILITANLLNSPSNLSNILIVGRVSFNDLVQMEND